MQYVLVDKKGRKDSRVYIYCNHLKKANKPIVTTSNLLYFLCETAGFEMMAMNSKLGIILTAHILVVLTFSKGENIGTVLHTCVKMNIECVEC